MDEINFRIWMLKQNYSKKFISDCTSRLKKLEKDFDYIDLDNSYIQDECSDILKAFSLKGENEIMKKYPNTSLPLGKYHLAAYKNALKHYINFCKSTNSSIPR